MSDRYVLHILESNIKEITMHSGKVFYSQHKLFTFRLLDAVTVKCRPRTKNNIVTRLAWQHSHVHSCSNYKSLLLYFQY